MTPNKVQHFQEWLKGFKKDKPVIIPVSKLPKRKDYEKSHVYEINEVSIDMPKEDELYRLTITTGQ